MFRRLFFGSGAVAEIPFESGRLLGLVLKADGRRGRLVMAFVSKLRDRPAAGGKEQQKPCRQKDFVHSGDKSLNH